MDVQSVFEDNGIPQLSNASGDNRRCIGAHENRTKFSYILFGKVGWTDYVGNTGLYCY